MDARETLIIMLCKDAKTRNADETGETLEDRVIKTIFEIDTLNSYPEDEQAERLFELIKDHIKQDSDSIDLKLFKELLELQFQYYLRCADANSKNYKYYKHIARNPKKYYDMVVTEGPKAEVKLTFKINMLAPIQQTLNELKLFNSGIKTLLKFNAMITLNGDEIKSSRMSALFVFCMEIAGSKKIWSNKIANWKKSLMVYDWYNIDKLTKTEITKKLGVYNVKDNSNSLKEVRDLLTEAERLVQSVNDGSFPL